MAHAGQHVAARMEGVRTHKSNTALGSVVMLAVTHQATKRRHICCWLLLVNLKRAKLASTQTRVRVCRHKFDRIRLRLSATNVEL